MEIYIHQRQRGNKSQASRKDITYANIVSYRMLITFPMYTISQLETVTTFQISDIALRNINRKYNFYYISVRSLETKLSRCRKFDRKFRDFTVRFYLRINANQFVQFSVRYSIHTSKYFQNWLILIVILLFKQWKCSYKNLCLPTAYL